MATRPAPTAEQVVEALSDTSNLQLQHLGGNRAVVWINGILQLRRAFRTNTPKAEEWLLGIINAEDSPLILIEVGPVVAHLTGPTLRELTPQRLDWPDEVHHNFRFDDRGRLVTSARKSRAGSYTNYTRWLVLRDALPLMRDQVAADVAESDRERHETRSRDAAAFHAIHGTDFEVLRELLDGANIALTEEDRWIEPDAISTWMSTSAKHAELWGTPGSVTISLRGTQITAVANRIRELLSRQER